MDSPHRMHAWFFLGRPGSALLFALALGSCGGDSTGPLEPCDGPVEVTVQNGTQPRFQWTPACRVARLAVVTPVTAGYLTLWEVVSDPWAIEPGVRYGETPSGATVVVAPQPLMASWYRVVVLTDGIDAIGAANFGPP